MQSSAVYVAQSARYYPNRKRTRPPGLAGPLTGPNARLYGPGMIPAPGEISVTHPKKRVPLVYFVGVSEGSYFPIFPVYVVGEGRNERAFFVQADDQAIISVETEQIEDSSGRRRYVTRLVQQRLHQEEFRSRVIRAYRTNCAVCRLHAHPELLDAAHILPDGHPLGRPVIANGLSLCKLHHAAFDSNVIGIRADYIVEVRKDVLKERDGPMLRHGLQGLDRTQLVVPTRAEHKPNPAFLEERFELFRKAV
jgi:putative restriction endonuclease